MGIKKDVTKLFGPTAEFSKIEVLYKEIGNKTIFVDASNEIYRAMLGCEKLTKLTDPDGNPTLHISVLYSNISERIRLGISEFWVFDFPGENIYKKEEVEARRAAREKAVQQKTTSLSSNYTTEDDLKAAVEKLEARLETSHVEDIKILLDYFGIKWTEAPQNIEAEQLCAHLARKEKGYVLTVDFDALVFGAPASIQRKKVKTEKGRKTVLYLFVLDEILKEKEITMEEFRRICVILGSDWAPGTPRVGAKTVMKKYKKIELTPEQEKALEIFSSEPNIEGLKIHEEQMNLQKLEDWLVEEKGFNRERIKKQLSKII